MFVVTMIWILAALAAAMWCMGYVFNQPWSTLHDQAMSRQVALSAVAFFAAYEVSRSILVALGLYQRVVHPCDSINKE
jgi:hypothetical protein